MTETRAPVLILIPRTHSARARDQLPVPGSVDASGEIFTEGNRERAEAGQAEPGHSQAGRHTGPGAQDKKVIVLSSVLRRLPGSTLQAGLMPGLQDF